MQTSTLKARRSVWEWQMRPSGCARDGEGVPSERDTGQSAVCDICFRSWVMALVVHDMLCTFFLDSKYFIIIVFKNKVTGWATAPGQILFLLNRRGTGVNVLSAEDVGGGAAAPLRPTDSSRSLPPALRRPRDEERCGDHKPVPASGWNGWCVKPPHGQC